MVIVIHRDNKNKEKSWYKYIRLRIKQNKNFLCCVVGATGSGKTYASMKICEDIAKENKTEFGVENVVFSFNELMKFINKGDYKKGTCIVFDEGQISLSAREFQSKANRIFNYLLTTFRHQNFILFFTLPYEDLLDKTARKLLHAKFETVSINTNKQTVRLKPFTVQYNSGNSKFYYKYLRSASKPEGYSRFRTIPLHFWDIPLPSEELIDKYEVKKKEFTDKLNLRIAGELQAEEGLIHLVK